MDHFWTVKLNMGDFVEILNIEMNQRKTDVVYHHKTRNLD